MREGMLLGFVEELGHEYHHLLEDVTEEKEAIPDRTAVLVANTHIQEAMEADFINPHNKWGQRNPRRRRRDKTARTSPTRS